MKRTRRFSGLGACVLACYLAAGNVALAHPLLFSKPLLKPPAPHAGTNLALSAFLIKGSRGLFLSKLNEHLAVANFNQAFPGPGSLATRHVAALLRSVVENGVKAGEAQTSVPSLGGNIVSGQIQGDLYVVSPDDPIPFYQNAGEFTGTVGTNLTANVPTAGCELANA